MLQEGQNTITAVAGDGYGRTAADTITVTLITKGSITGTVTDSSTGLAISGASVAIKDPLNVIHSTTTDDNGKYTVSGITQGSFAAFFEKTGYENNTVTGTLNAGETKTVDVQLTPIKPLAVKITSPLDGAVISATYGDVKGTVSDPAATVIVNGIKAIVSGNTFEAKGIQLTPGPNSITAKATDGNGRTASDTIIVNYNQLSISITYPSEGEVLSTPSVSVEGIISDPSAYVEVNGIPASVSSGGSFIAHGITLFEGTNLITAQGVNTTGRTAEDTVRVYYQPLSLPLSIRVLSPTEGSGIETPYFTVSGVVSDPTATVIINDTIAKVEDNFFSASIYSCKPPITPESVSIKQQSWVCTVTVSTYSNDDQVAVTSFIYTYSPSDNPFTVKITDPVHDRLVTSSPYYVSGEINDVPFSKSTRSTLKVNGVSAGISYGEYGIRFSAPVPLQDGVNYITVQATNIVGHDAFDTVKVFYEAPGKPLGITIYSPLDQAIVNYSPIAVSGGVTHSTAEVQM